MWNLPMWQRKCKKKKSRSETEIDKKQKKKTLCLYMCSVVPVRDRQHAARDKKVPDWKDWCLSLSTSLSVALCSFPSGSCNPLARRLSVEASFSSSPHTLTDPPPHTHTHTHTGRERAVEWRKLADKVLIMSWQCLASVHPCHSSVAGFLVAGQERAQRECRYHRITVKR